MKVVCLDASNKPTKIPNENWIVENEVYTVIDTKQMGLQKNTLGFKLAEVSIPEKCFPYEFYSASRFGVIIAQTEIVEDTSTEGSDFDSF
jgi:hypothetical protein